MNNQPASEESIRTLYINIGHNFPIYTSSLCSFVDIYDRLEKINENKINKKHINELRLWKELIKLNIASMIISLDLLTFLRANFKSASTTEKRCNLKYINVITIEGYKYFFGLKKDDKTNAIQLNISNIKTFLNDENLNIKINNILIHAEEFKNKYAQSIHIDSRNFSVHYDNKPIRVYDNIVQLDENIEVQKVSAFLAILEPLSSLTSEFIANNIESLKKLLKSLTPYDLSIKEIINSFRDKDNKLATKLNSQITEFGKCLDSIVTSCNMPQSIANKLMVGENFAKAFNPIIESTYLGIHLHFIYLDLACAIKAYLNSDFYLEKQMNLRRIRVVLYEGFKKIYGFKNNQESNSFWRKYIYNILQSSTDSTIISKLTATEKELIKLSEYQDLKDDQKREYSIHYRYKEKDNIIPIFNQLINANPILEMDKALRMIRLLPTILELNTSSLQVVYNIESDKIKSENYKTATKIDNLISMINSSCTNDQIKQDLIDSINKLKEIHQSFSK